MNDCLVTYIESDVFDNIDNEAIMQRFSNYEVSIVERIYKTSCICF